MSKSSPLKRSTKLLNLYPEWSTGREGGKEGEGEGKREKMKELTVSEMKEDTPLKILRTWNNSKINILKTVGPIILIE